jgi:alkanesulfonate monooxygenase SsuD/methylene tetrahydromethanopterin reductase-like flavin-dependent oxidoreductase (luciferase family)
VRLGLGPIPLREIGRAELMSLAQAATAASFDAVWVAEDRAAGAGGGLAAAAMLAQLVPVRVGAVIDFGSYHPLYAAEDIAVADLASGGRIEVVLRGGTEEQVRLLLDALSGAHLRFDGAEIRVPGRLEANQPSPQSLALNPRPAQPAVPIWIEGVDAGEWPAPVAHSSRPWPPILICPGSVRPDELLRAAGPRAVYFLIAATSTEQVADAGRRLIGPLRMPEFPEWIN